MKQVLWQLLPILLALLGGIVCTMFVAFSAAVWSPRPHMWAMNAAVDDDARAGLDTQHPGSAHIATWLAAGFGYRSLDLRLFDAAEIASSRFPVETRRSFWTTLGWPNAAFATNERRMGLRFAGELGPNSPSDDASLHDGQPTVVRVLWSGFCFNALLFAAVFLLPSRVLLRRKASGFCLPPFSFIAICLGLWCALLVAWSADLAHHAVPFTPRSFEVFNDPNAFVTSIGARVGARDLPSPSEWDAFHGTVSRSIGYRASTFSFTKSVPVHPAASVVSRSELSLGWPVSCLKGPQISAWHVTNSPSPSDDRRRHVVALTATPVWWPGMLVNWLFYGAAIVMLVRGPAVLRRIYRRHKNRCHMCGYPIGEGSRCSECGQRHANIAEG